MDTARGRRHTTSSRKGQRGQSSQRGLSVRRTATVPGIITTGEGAKSQERLPSKWVSNRCTFRMSWLRIPFSFLIFEEKKTIGRIISDGAMHLHRNTKWQTAEEEVFLKIKNSNKGTSLFCYLCDGQGLTNFVFVFSFLSSRAFFFFS